MLALGVLAARSAFAGAVQGSGGVCGWALVLGLAALVVWQTLLGLCNALVVTADLALETDALVIRMTERWQVRVAPADITAGEAFEVLYRLGRAERIKGPVIRPRRRPATAVFMPVRAVSAGRVLFWAVARMYAGHRARYGFLITPDHAQNKDLLERLQQVSDLA